MRAAERNYNNKTTSGASLFNRPGARVFKRRSQSVETPLVLLCPAWKKWGTAKIVKANTTILHSRADDVVPFEDSKELVNNSGLPASALINVGTDHRLADKEPLAKTLKACIS